MTGVAASYFSNTYVPIASYTVDQSFFHMQIAPISGPDISEEKNYLSVISLCFNGKDTCKYIYK